MTIPIQREPPDMGPAEWCCFCFKPSRTWTNMSERTPGQQVACCAKCAEEHQPAEVPTKARWVKDVESQSSVSGRRVL